MPALSRPRVEMLRCLAAGAGLVTDRGCGYPDYDPAPPGWVNGCPPNQQAVAAAKRDGHIEVAREEWFDRDRPLIARVRLHWRMTDAGRAALAQAEATRGRRGAPTA